MQVKTLSRGLYWLLLVPLIFLPAMWVYFLIFLYDFAHIARSNLHLPIQWHTVMDWQWYLTWLVTLLPAIILVWGIVHLRRAFYAFAQNDIFTINNVTYIKRFAFSLLASVVLKTILFSVVSVILSANHPAGQKLLSIQFNSYDLMTFAIGLVFWLISKILIQAHGLMRENQQFV